MSSPQLSYDSLEWIEPSMVEGVEKYSYDKGKSIYGGILPFLRNFEPMGNADDSYRDSIAHFMTKQISPNEHNVTPSRELALQSLCGYIALAQILRGPSPTKKGNFVYLPDDPEEPPLIKIARSVINAQFMTENFGNEIFAGTLQKNGGYYRSNIDDRFAVTAKAGTGAGTFSIDFAIEENRHGDVRDQISPSHELWRAGIDMLELDDTNSIGRIVRIGSGIKPGDEKKLNALSDFKNKYNIVPGRALAFIAAHALHSLRLDSGLALSSYGAMQLSTLSRAKGEKKAGYSQLFEAAGFSQGRNPYWLELQFDSFYDATIAKTPDEAGIQAHEAESLDTIFDSFNHLTTGNSVEFPLKLCTDDPVAVVESSLEAHYERRGYKRSTFFAGR